MGIWDVFLFFGGGGHVHYQGGIGWKILADSEWDVIYTHCGSMGLVYLPRNLAIKCYKKQLFMRRFWGFPLCYYLFFLFFFWGGGHVENMENLHQAALFGILVL